MKLKVVLKRSLIGRLPRQVKTAETLGLRRINDEVVLEDAPFNQGKIKTIAHLVEVVEVK